jgi:thiol-disulfide isomerase/thioredoxin
MKKYKFFIFVVLGITGIAYAMSQRPENGSQENKNIATEISQTAPDFNLKELGSERRYVSLSSLRGTPVFIDFWASWCPPCRQSIPYVEELYEKYKGKVQFIGINLDRNSDAALDFIKKNSMSYLQLDGTGSDAPSKYGVRGIPSFFIIDKEGNIVKNYSGFSYGHYQDWIAVLDKLIQQ